jgi:hypothetical protein
MAAVDHLHLNTLLLSSEEGVDDFVKKVAALEGFTVSIQKVGPMEVGHALGLDSFQAVVLVDDISENLRLLAPRLSESIAPGGTLYLSTFSDTVRHDALLSRSAAISLLRDKGFGPCAHAYYAFFRRLRPGESFGEPPQVADLDIQDRALFVVGHARSGSSVVFHLVNDQPDIHMTYEANLFLVKNRHDIVANYNTNQQRFGRKVGKGFRLPVLGSPDQSLNAINRALLSHYAIIGDKVALGARGESWEPQPATQAFDWFESQFPFARYLCLLREPREAIAAMDRMHEGRKPAMLVESWTRTALLILDIILTFPQRRMMFFENLVEGDYRPLLSLLDRSELINRQDISYRNKSTNSAHTESFFARSDIEPLRDLAFALSDWYRRFRNLFDSDTGLPVDNVDPDALDTMRAEMRALNAQLEDHLNAG